MDFRKSRRIAIEAAKWARLFLNRSSMAQARASVVLSIIKKPAKRRVQEAGSWDGVDGDEANSNLLEFRRKG